jgi:hypothetical protein
MGCCKGNKCEQCSSSNNGKKFKKDSDCTTSTIEAYSSSNSFSLLNFSSNANELSNWLHQEGYEFKKNKKVKEGPIFMFKEIVKKYGKPDILVNKQKGLCIWYVDQKDNDVHHTIELKDQYVEHCVPAEHNDFLYSYIRVYIPPKKIKQVIAVSGSVGYDGLQKLLYARCASFEANMATLASVFLVLNSEDPNYVYQIKNRYASFKKNNKYVKKHLLKNQKKYKKKLNQPFYDLAFPGGCK